MRQPSYANHHAPTVMCQQSYANRHVPIVIISQAANRHAICAWWGVCFKELSVECTFRCEFPFFPFTKEGRVFWRVVELLTEEPSATAASEDLAPSPRSSTLLVDTPRTPYSTIVSRAI